MGTIKTSRTLFFTTSPRSPKKLLPEIDLLIRDFGGQIWSGKHGCQEAFACALAKAETFEGETSKKYSTFSARDRITRSPQGLGFVNLTPTIQLTEAGRAFLHGKRPHEIFFRQLMKFQLPSPYLRESQRVKGTFWGHPYLEIMRLIRELEYLTPDEFQIFALQVTDYRDFDLVKSKITSFREEKQRRAGQYKMFADEVIRHEISEIYAVEIASGDIATRESRTTDIASYIKKKKQSMRDYADACFRYLRYTEMFLSDGKSIRIAPDKLLEVDYVLSTIDRNPIFIDDVASYKAYLFDAQQPALYSDIRENIEDILMRRFSFSRRDLTGKTIEELKDLRDTIIAENREGMIREQTTLLKSYALYQEVMDTYNEIMTDDIYDAPLFLEWNTWRAMTMLDGGDIKGNFKIDDSGRPSSTAQGNMPDIECDYGDFALSVEVTLQRGQRQYDSEGEPVTRHYARLQQKMNKATYCLFIAEKISKATWEHFFGLNQIKNIAAYGGKPRIIPLELDQFMRLVENSYSYHDTPTPSDVRSFLQSAINQIDQSEDENDWKERIEQCVSGWLVA